MEQWYYYADSVQTCHAREFALPYLGYFITFTVTVYYFVRRLIISLVTENVNKQAESKW